MDKITVIEGDDLDYLLGVVLTIGSQADIFRLRVWQSDDGTKIKIKVNERTWTPPVGELDRR